MSIVKKLKLKGFKSFAKPTELVFGEGFNTIIGANGSGKSNVCDSLCFVLGKISAKSMRAEKSANLIFNGGKKGSPMKEAQVEIYFDNSKNEFPVNEKIVKISRIIRQNGNSIYKINDEKRTRQQVLELLSTAKIDPEGHNIILQGDIIRLTDMKPDERRGIIEEIAGISIYEDKKGKALNELENVESRLNEARIILTEREAHLRELKKERDHAIKFKNLEKNIKENKATFLHLQIKEKEDKRSNIENQINKHNQILNRINNKLNELRTKIENNKKKLNQINLEIEERGERGQVLLQKEIEQLKTSIIRDETRLETCEKEIQKIKERKEQLKKNLEELNKKIEELNKRKAILERGIVEIKEKESVIGAKLNGIKGDSRFLDEIENLQNKIFNLQEIKQNTLRENDKIKSELENIENTLKLEKDNKIKNKVDELKKITENLKEEFSKSSVLSARLEKTRFNLTQNSKELSEIISKQARIKGSLSNDLAIKRILSLKGVYGTVSELGKVDSKYALALGVAAGGRANGVVASDDKVAAECIKILKKEMLGVVTFFPLNKIKEKQTKLRELIKIEGVHGIASDLVSFDKKFNNIFSYILGNTLIVDDVNTARRIGVGRARMVTLDGDLFEQSGVIVGGFRRRINLSFQEKELTEELKKKENIVTNLNDLTKNLEKEKGANEKTITRLRERKAELEGEILRFKKSQGIEDLNKLKEKHKNLLTNVKEKGKGLIETESEMANIGKRISELKQRRISPKSKTLEQEYENIRTATVEYASEIKNINEQINTIHLPEKEKIKKILKQQEKELEEFHKESKELSERLHKSKKNLKKEEEREAKFYKEYKGLFAKRNFVTEIIQKYEKTIMGEELKIKDVERKMNDVSLKRAKVVAELEALEKEFEEFRGTKIRRGVNLEELKFEIKKFENLLKNLGNVNLKALEVYDEIEAEYKKILEKVDKLKAEKEDVLKMMYEIESKKGETFMRTFKTIAANFKNIFSNLCVKGDAHLELEDKENPLEGGVDIKVKIVGNKFLDIRSLSGGEKTLTALALMFAIQEYQPAAFYLLDEIDAALDKTNSELLSRLINKYAKHAQYILISHNDVVITEADSIYGVSMQKNGISKVISLKL